MKNVIESIIVGRTKQEAINELEERVFLREMKDHLTTQDYLFIKEANNKINELRGTNNGRC